MSDCTFQSCALAALGSNAPSNYSGQLVLPILSPSANDGWYFLSVAAFSSSYQLARTSITALLSANNLPFPSLFASLENPKIHRMRHGDPERSSDSANVGEFGSSWCCVENRGNDKYATNLGE